MEQYPPVSIVVIGYNEASNLSKTFSAIKSINYPSDKIETIYVDSGSSDGSIEIARGFTNKIYVEDEFPSPGRNRNRGLVEAKYDIVHFIDGDVEIDKNYLRNIVHLFEEKNVQAIVGQLDEQRPNIYNKMAALSNVEKTEGYTQFTSTGATYLKSALMSVNGYDERIRRGQETELGERFRKAGYKIWCSRHKMGSHNFGVTNLWQYVQKDKINARSLVHISFIEGDSDYITSARSRLKRQFVKPVLFVLFLAISIITMNFYYLLTYWVVIWGMKNRSLVRQKFMSKPALVSLRCIIDFFFLWMWWYGVISGIVNYYFRKQNREYYHLRKTLLNEN